MFTVLHTLGNGAEAGIWFFWERINSRNLKRQEREVGRNHPLLGVRF